MVELPGVEEHELADKYPVRLPVWWARRGGAGTHPVTAGVSGRRVVLRFEKKFNRLERMAHRLLGGSKEIRRPLDDLNSLLWELCDGNRSFAEICRSLDSTFHERVAPVQERTALGLRNLKMLNCIAILDEPFADGWPTGPGVTPPNQNLPELDEALDFDAEPLDGEVCDWPEEE